MAWPDQSPVNEEDEGTCHCSYRSFGPHQRAEISDEGDLEAHFEGGVGRVIDFKLLSD